MAPAYFGQFNDHAGCCIWRSICRGFPHRPGPAALARPQVTRYPRRLCSLLNAHPHSNCASSCIRTTERQRRQSISTPSPRVRFDLLLVTNCPKPPFAPRGDEVQEGCFKVWSLVAEPAAGSHGGFSISASLGLHL